MRRHLLAVVAAALVVGTVAAVMAVADGRQPAASRLAASTPAAPGSHPRFVALSQQTSNRCDLQVSDITSYAPGRRLQGSCCNAMDEATYRAQVSSLRRFADNTDIPRDPYDISAARAQRLLRFDRTIKLSPDEQDTYRQAMQMSREKGPCCCQCWRRAAFRGLSKQLIAHGMRATELAHLIEALDGCGGGPAGDAAQGAPA